MAKELLANALIEALARAQQAGEIPPSDMPEVELQAPRETRHGDLSTSLPMVIASATGGKARDIAQAIVRNLKLPEGTVEKVEMAGPGFINFTLAPGWLRGLIRRIHRAGEDYGRSNAGGGKSLLLEFVSANPTGPLAVVNGRAAALGDALAHLFERVGWVVSREYYVNDATNSTQVRRFAETLEARYLQQLGQEAVVPEDGYQGDYVIEMAADLVRAEGDRYLKMDQEDRLSALYQHSLKKIVEGHQQDMAAFGVHFDTWFMESSLYANDEVTKALDALKAGGHTYEADGALWLRATDFGDDQDQVLIRTDGRPSYLAADIAYHKNKFDRGFYRLIDIWGPDHHGHVKRTKAGVEALGYDPDRFEILIHQIVRLFRGSEMVRMSKRAGDIIPLSGLLSDVGRDAARFFFLMQSMESHLDFDLELAKKQAADNPVYYVQYAHARICSILREGEARGIPPAAIDQVDLERLGEPDELALMRKLGDLPDETDQAAARYEPHRMTRYARELAAVFHGFYTNCRVLGDDRELTTARLALVLATRTVLRIVLQVVGVTAPEQM
jgi:arginyl-tRNA synthetase